MSAFEVAFYVTSRIGLVGAVMAFFLVRNVGKVESGPIFGRRSRWVIANQGRSGAITRQPPEDESSTVDNRG